MNARTWIFVPIVLFAVSCFAHELFDKIASGDFSSHTVCADGYTIKQLNEPQNGMTPLVAAIQRDNVVAVRTLVDAGVDVNQKVANQLPIEHAMQCVGVDVVKYLWAHGASLSANACVFAAQRPRMAQFLIGVFENYRFGSKKLEHNCFFLTRAMLDQCINVMLLHVQNEHQLVRLLRMGAHVQYVDDQQMGPLDYALRDGRYHIAKILFSQGARARADVLQETKAASCTSDYCTFARARPVLEQVSSAGNVADTIDVQLFAMIKDGTLSQDFLEKYFSGINRRSLDRTFAQYGGLDALSYAITHDGYEATRLLLKFGAHNVRGALIGALKRCSKKIIKLLIKHGATLNSIVQPLEIIIQHNENALEVLDWLAPRRMRAERNRALLFACLQAKLPLVQVLVQHGACVDYCDDAGNTPLYNALLGRSVDVIVWLLANGARDTLSCVQRTFMKIYFSAGVALLDAERSL